MDVEFNTRIEKLSIKPEKGSLIPKLSLTLETFAKPELLVQFAQLAGQAVTVIISSAQRSFEDHAQERAAAEAKDAGWPTGEAEGYAFVIDDEGNIIDGEHRLLPAPRGENEPLSEGAAERRRRRLRRQTHAAETGDDLATAGFEAARDDGNSVGPDETAALAGQDVSRE